MKGPARLMRPNAEELDCGVLLIGESQLGLRLPCAYQGERLLISPKSLSTLEFLVLHPCRVVSKAELGEGGHPEIAAVEQATSKLPRAGPAHHRGLFSQRSKVTSAAGSEIQVGSIVESLRRIRYEK